MDSIYEDVLNQVVTGGRAQVLGQKIGADAQATTGAVEAALPVLFGALARNASQPQGAQALASALDRDHDGSVLDDVMGMLGGGGGGSFGGGASGGGLGGGIGEAILGHMLGGRKGAVESELGRQTGLDSSAITQLLATLAPLVMGALGRAKRERGLDPDGLAYELGRERQQAEAARGNSFGGLGRILDMDGDGRIDDHVVKMGTGLLGRLFGRRR